MTVPTQMNCEHSPDGWCLKCVNKLVSELARISLINHHISEEKQDAFQAGIEAARGDLDIAYITGYHKGRALMKAEAVGKCLWRVQGDTPRDHEARRLSEIIGGLI